MNRKQSFMAATLIFTLLALLLYTGCEDKTIVESEEQTSLSTRGGIGITLRTDGIDSDSGIFLGYNPDEIMIGAFSSAGNTHGFISAGRPSTPSLFSIGTTSNDDFSLAAFNPGITYNSQTGNIGVNNPSPNYDLDVNGNANIQNDLFITGNVGIGTTNPGTSLEVNGNTNIQNNLIVSGNVGIGTTNPGTSLDVNGSITTRNIFIENVSDPLYLRETGETGAGSLWRMPLDGRHLRFDASMNGNDFSSYTTAIDMYSNGDVLIPGNLSKGGGSFKIDHPLDPENKYLSHSFIESPDMMNVYNGNVILDDKGEAIVKLPDYFEALNSDFRYQLTCIGGFAPIYVKEEIKNHRFKIAGGENDMKVSWQVTGVRKDAYAEVNRIQVESDKDDAEKGHYLHPEAFGYGSDKSIHNATNRSGNIELSKKEN